MQIIERGNLNDQDIGIFAISFISGIRAAGKEADKQVKGREKDGILYLLRGECRIFAPDQPELIIRAGDVVLLPREYRYKLRYTGEESEFKLVNFEVLAACGHQLAISDRIEIVTDKVNIPAFTNILDKIEINCRAEDDTAVLRRKELVYRLLCLLFAQVRPLNIQKPKYTRILPGVLLLQQTFLEDVPISQLAATCNISISSFRGLFTEYYGVAPSVYRNELRIKHARSLLIDGNCTVAEAASGSGFNNLSYFCRCYKKVTGETPSKTQRSL